MQQKKFLKGKIEAMNKYYLNWPPFSIVDVGLGAREHGNDEVGVDPMLSLFPANLGFCAEPPCMIL